MCCIQKLYTKYRMIFIHSLGNLTSTVYFRPALRPNLNRPTFACQCTGQQSYIVGAHLRDPDSVVVSAFT